MIEHGGLEDDFRWETRAWLFGRCWVWFSGAKDSRFSGRVNVNMTALTGMSFGGWTTAACLELKDPRVKAAVLMRPGRSAWDPSALRCPSLMSAQGRLTRERTNLETPLMMMLGCEDVVIGSEGNEACRQYARYPEGHGGSEDGFQTFCEGSRLGG